MDTVIVIGLGSDIGRELALRFASDGWKVKGTYRSQAGVRGLPAAIESVPCELSSRESISAAHGWMREHCQGWRALVVAAGTEEPIGPFWDCDPDEWDRGIGVNSLGPLRLVRALYPLRDRAGSPSVAFFSGSGTNNAAPAYSAYCASKIMLIKMCELLDAESPDTSFFIIGPGIVRTKIHDETLRASARAGANYLRVADFLRSSDAGTSHDDIYACARWCMSAGKKIVGGRNISLVHDAWRAASAGELEQWLAGDANRYKLRRFGNEYRLGRPDQ
jgi:NAD(P)-dependent dehydrogenase (short-subunit alcohol dehydrogenase family)